MRGKKKIYARDLFEWARIEIRFPSFSKNVFKRSAYVWNVWYVTCTCASRKDREIPVSNHFLTLIKRKKNIYIHIKSATVSYYWSRVRFVFTVNFGASGWGGKKKISANFSSRVNKRTRWRRAKKSRSSVLSQVRP